MHAFSASAKIAYMNNNVRTSALNERVLQKFRRSTLFIVAARKKKKIKFLERDDSGKERREYNSSRELASVERNAD